MLAKGDTLQMGKYFVTYSGREKKGHNIYFDVEYYKLNNKTGELKKAFSLKPIIQREWEILLNRQQNGFLIKIFIHT